MSILFFLSEIKQKNIDLFIKKNTYKIVTLYFHLVVYSNIWFVAADSINWASKFEWCGGGGWFIVFRHVFIYLVVPKLMIFELVYKNLNTKV